MRVHANANAAAAGQAPPPPPEGDPSQMALAQAAQWVANKYWRAGEALGAAGSGGEAAPGGADSLKAVYADLVKIMQQVGNEGIVGKPLSLSLLLLCSVRM